MERNRTASKKYFSGGITINIFKNNYIKLLDENERASCKLESTTAYDIRCIMDYFRGYGIPLFEMEVIKKDILGLAKEADLEHVTLEEKLGMPLQEFCENMKREGSSSHWFGHLLKALQSACFIYTLICTFDFLLFICEILKITGLVQAISYSCYYF